MRSWKKQLLISKPESYLRTCRKWRGISDSASVWITSNQVFDAGHSLIAKGYVSCMASLSSRIVAVKRVLKLKSMSQRKILDFRAFLGDRYRA